MKSTKTNPKSVTVTVADFDNAIASPFNPDTCLIAQTAKRYGMEHNTAIAFHSKKAAAMRSTFDEHFFSPGDEKKPELKALRAKLPVKLHLS